MYKNLYVSADANVKKIKFDLRNKVSQRITIETARLEYRRTVVGLKRCPCIGRNAVKFDPDEYQNSHTIAPFKRRICANTSYRAPITVWEQSQTFLIKIGPSSVPTHNLYLMGIN